MSDFPPEKRHVDDNIKNECGGYNMSLYLKFDKRNLTFPVFILLVISLVLIIQTATTFNIAFAREDADGNRVESWDELVGKYAVSDHEVVIPEGTIVYIDRNILYSDPEGIWIITGGGTIARGETSATLLSFSGNARINISGITFDGSMQKGTEEPVNGILDISGSASVELDKVVVCNNAGTEPAVHVRSNADVKINECTFRSNKISKSIYDKSNKLLSASAIYIEKSNTALISDSTFDSNDGAHALNGFSRIDNCIFTNNTNGGAVVGCGEITDCKFTGNTGYYGVAILLNGESTIRNCVIESNKTLEITQITLDSYGSSLSDIRESLKNGNATNNSFAKAALNQAGCVYVGYDVTLEDFIIQNNEGVNNYGAIRVNPYQHTTLTIQGKKTNITDDIYGGPITNNSTGTFDRYPEIKELVFANPFGSYVSVNLSGNVYDSILIVKDGARLKNSIDIATIKIQGLVYIESITYTDFKITSALDSESHIEILGCETQDADEYPRFHLMNHLYETGDPYTVASGVDGYNVTESDIACFAIQGNTWKDQKDPKILSVYFGSELKDYINNAEAYHNKIVLFNGNMKSPIESNTINSEEVPICTICGTALCMECKLCPNCTDLDHIEVIINTEKQGDHDHKNPPADNEDNGSNELVDDSDSDSNKSFVKSVMASVKRINGIVGCLVVSLGVFGGCIALPILVYRKTEILRDMEITDYEEPKWMRVHRTLIHKVKTVNHVKSFEVKIPTKVVHLKAVDSYKIRMNKHFVKKNHGNELLIHVENNPTTYHFVIDMENPEYIFKFPQTQINNQ